MSIRREQVIYPYVNCNFGAYFTRNAVIASTKNLKELFLFIGEDADINPKNENGKLGRAYEKIYRQLNPYRFRVLKRKISKRQIKQLVECHGNNDGYIKIPYLINEIFRAVFTIVEKETRDRALPTNISHLKGYIRRDCFYSVQAQVYSSLCDDPNNTRFLTSLRVDLNNDINTNGNRCGELGRAF